MGARFFAPVQTGPGAHSSYCTMGTGSFPGVKIGRSVTLTPHSLLVPWSCKGRAIPLLPLWAVRPVQSPSVCTRVTFTFTFMLHVYMSLQTQSRKFNIKLRNLLIYRPYVTINYHVTYLQLSTIVTS